MRCTGEQRLPCPRLLLSAAPSPRALSTAQAASTPRVRHVRERSRDPRTPTSILPCRSSSCCRLITLSPHPVQLRASVVQLPLNLVPLLGGAAHDARGQQRASLIGCGERLLGNNALSLAPPVCCSFTTRSLNRASCQHPSRQARA